MINRIPRAMSEHVCDDAAQTQQPPSPQLVAVDGNGTLLGADGSSISEYTRQIVQRVQALGVPVVLVTGRPFAKAKPTLELAGMQNYVVTENGARAVRISDGKSMFEQWIDGPEAAKPVIAIKEQLPGRCFFAQITSDGGLIESKHPWRCAEAEEATRSASERYFVKAVPDITDALVEGRKCAKSYVTVPESHNFAATMVELRSAVGPAWEVRQVKQLVPGMSNTCEVQSVSVNKADGLAGLCKEINIPLESVWAFGDDSNDIRMLTEMGWGVRMANHQPALAGVGDDVTALSNEDDGFAHYLEAKLLHDALVVAR